MLVMHQGNTLRCSGQLKDGEGETKDFDIGDGTAEDKEVAPKDGKAHGTTKRLKDGEGEMKDSDIGEGTEEDKEAAP